ncbi:hypothetical protein ACQP1G_06425 [Nocardia sp. CA-107356]|uniref:hypothetical protein n=1 Tax=Nocardia sp. CA-107356 TaxID=3239972 RepID=UPI003D8FC4DE
MGVDVATELRRLEKERSTGVLCAGDGAFHLADGAITAADCLRTANLDLLAVAAGVATAEELRRAAAGDPRSVLARPRLETLALLSVFDAAYFLLATPVVPEFRPAPPHWLTPVCHIPPRVLLHECARRGDPEAEPWPAELVDRAPVVPVRRVRRRRVTLTGGQTEVLAAADGRRSIAGIARDLGRTSYGALVAVRELTTAGLIEAPDQVPVATVWSELVPTVPTAVAVTEPRQFLPRRVRQPVAVPAPTPDPDNWKPVDRDLLIRLHAALEELA